MKTPYYAARSSNSTELATQKVRGTPQKPAEDWLESIKLLLVLLQTKTQIVIADYCNEYCSGSVKPFSLELSFNTNSHLIEEQSGDSESGKSSQSS